MVSGLDRYFWSGSPAPFTMWRVERQVLVEAPSSRDVIDDDFLTGLPPRAVGPRDLRLPPPLPRRNLTVTEMTSWVFNPSVVCRGRRAVAGGGLGRRW